MLVKITRVVIVSQLFYCLLLSQTLYVPSGIDGIGTSTSGNVGIGVSNPTHKLEIKNGTIWAYTDGGGESIPLMLGEYSDPNTNNPFLYFITNDATDDLFKICLKRYTANYQWTLSSQNTPSEILGMRLYSHYLNGSRLELYGNQSDNTIKVQLNANGYSYLNGGNVGIGITSPWSRLDVAEGGARIRSSGDRTLYCNKSWVSIYRNGVLGNDFIPLHIDHNPHHNPDNVLARMGRDGGLFICEGGYSHPLLAVTGHGYIGLLYNMYLETYGENAGEWRYRQYNQHRTGSGWELGNGYGRFIIATTNGGDDYNCIGYALQLMALKKTEIAFSPEGNQTMSVKSGKVGIGTTSPAFPLDVVGTIRTNGLIKADEIQVTENGADFVFEPDYDLPTLEEVETHIKEHKHLPDIPSAEEMQANGTNMGEMQTKLLQKIEELTLYTLQQQKEIEVLKKEIQKVKN